MQKRFYSASAVLLMVGLVFFGTAGRAEEPIGTYAPHIAAASDEGQRALSGFRVPQGLRAELVAAEPLLANPVAFCFDEQGRIFVAETYRQNTNTGAEDNRSHMHWLDDDLAAQTVEDRLAYVRKHLGEKIADYTLHRDRIRLLEDRDHDGKYESSTVFDDRFHEIEDGTGAGVLARGGNVYYTCIPHLWRLRDTNGDGVADERTSLHRGYGVRYAFRGHDLHGLRFGPDGKLYYSIGDRGFNVTADGRTLAYPDRGAVFRCNPDGSELELVAHGLRNPQELAFDEYGNLFTGDNNSDSGDRARWVYVVEGGDSGWRMNYQYLNDRGPWNRERLWDPQFDGQAAYIVPPITHITSGPSGLTYYPGVGLGDEYQGKFFLVDFRGSPGSSGVLTLSVEPKGAGFELVEPQEFFWSILATDVEFGPDGGLYVSDWVEGWTGPGKGRIYRLFDPAQGENPLVQETKRLIAEGMSQRTPEDLERLLAHRDMRVRQAAQFELADRGVPAVEILQRVAKDGYGNRLARLHAIWGLGQIGRRTPESLHSVLNLVEDSDAEVRAQAVKVLGDARMAEALERLIARLGDEVPRVQFFAAQSLGKLGRSEAIRPLVEMLRKNNDQDVYLRHAGVMGLAGTGDVPGLSAFASDPSPAARMGILLALRKLESREIARFLDDPDPRLVVEAARAIHDLPIPDALPALSRIITRSYQADDAMRDALWRRVLNANFQLGEPDQAAAVARFAARSDVPESSRLEALDMLTDWAKPGKRDRVLGSWHPLGERDANIAAEVLQPALPALLSAPDSVRQRALQVAARLGIREVGPVLFELLAEQGRPGRVRAEAVEALYQLRDRHLDEAVQRAMKDAEPIVRAAGLSIFARLKPEEALPVLENVLAGNSLLERQTALAALADVSQPAADRLLLAWMDKLLAGEVPLELQLDLLTAAGKRPSAEIQAKLAEFESRRSQDDLLAAYRETLAGGNAERGRRIFLERAEVSCVRCHRADGVGGDVGPDLSKIGVEKQREYLLESIVVPNKAIAKGFDSVTLALDDGQVVSGVLRGEDDEQIRIVTAEGKLVVVPQASVEDRASGKSPMPEDVAKKLSKSELRDLVEFLAGLKLTDKDE